MTVSIVMSYFNRPSQLRLTLESIRSQQVEDVEVIIVDDGSDDEQSASRIAGVFDDLEINVIHDLKMTSGG